jgi:hypothetical protein
VASSSWKLSFFIKTETAGDMAQAVERLPHKYEALSSNLSTTQKKKKNKPNHNKTTNKQRYPAVLASRAEIEASAGRGWTVYLSSLKMRKMTRVADRGWVRVPILLPAPSCGSLGHPTASQGQGRLNCGRRTVIVICGDTL